MKMTLYEAIAYTLLGAVTLAILMALSDGIIGVIIIGSLLSACYLIPGVSFWILWWKERKHK